MDRPKMDRPRHRRGTPFGREAARLLKAGLLITAVVVVVGALPVIFLWLYAGDLDDRPVNLAYRDEDVRYLSDGIEIVGRLRLPPYDGPHPALVIAHGSGPTTRDRHAELGRDLALNGYALLSYDKRGVGESQGTYSPVTPDNSEAVFAQLSADVLAGVGFLRARPDIDPEQIGILGVSQGGWVAPLAAARSPDVSLLVLVSAPAVTVGEEIYYSELTGEREGTRAGPTAQELSAELRGFTGPRGFDPLPYLEALAIPSLWILGEEDRSIPVPETVAVLERLVAAGKPVTLELLPGVGHGMRELDDNLPAPVFPIIFRWLVQNAGATQAAGR